MASRVSSYFGIRARVLRLARVIRVGRLFTVFSRVRRVLRRTHRAKDLDYIHGSQKVYDLLCCRLFAGFRLTFRSPQMLRLEAFYNNEDLEMLGHTGQILLAYSGPGI